METWMSISLEAQRYHTLFFLCLGGIVGAVVYLLMRNPRYRREPFRSGQAASRLASVLVALAVLLLFYGASRITGRTPPGFFRLDANEQSLRLFYRDRQLELPRKDITSVERRRLGRRGYRLQINTRQGKRYWSIGLRHKASLKYLKIFRSKLSLHAKG